MNLSDFFKIEEQICRQKHRYRQEQKLYELNEVSYMTLHASSSKLNKIFEFLEPKNSGRYTKFCSNTTICSKVIKEYKKKSEL